MEFSTRDRAPCASRHSCNPGGYRRIPWRLKLGLFLRGQGGFGGPRGPDDEQPWTEPDYPPDLTVSLQIPFGQALIYRLLGDTNPTRPIRRCESRRLSKTDILWPWNLPVSPAAPCSRDCAMAMHPLWRNSRTDVETGASRRDPRNAYLASRWRAQFARLLMATAW